MSKQGKNLMAELAKIRNQQLAASQTKIEAQKEREERIKKQQAAGAKKPGPRGPRKPKPNTSNAATTSGAAASSGGATDWKIEQPKLPLGMRQKQVIDHLREIEAPASVAELKAALNLDIAAQRDLRQALEANPKIGLDDEGNYFYRPDSNIRNKAQLLDFVRKSASPVAVRDIQDAYKAVAADIKALKDEGLILTMHSFDPDLQCEILYPVDMRLTEMKVDTDISTLWNQIEVPDDDETLKMELEKIGLKPAPRKAPRKAKLDKEQKKKQRSQQRLRAITNVHLAHLLEGDGPVSIDT